MIYRFLQPVWRNTTFLSSVVNKFCGITDIFLQVMPRLLSSNLRKTQQLFRIKALLNIQISRELRALLNEVETSLRFVAHKLLYSAAGLNHFIFTNNHLQRVRRFGPWWFLSIAQAASHPDL